MGRSLVDVYVNVNLVSVGGVLLVEQALHGGEHVVAGALLPWTRLAHGLLEHFMADRLQRAGRARRDLHVAGGLQGAHNHKGFGNRFPPGKKSMVVQVTPGRSGVSTTLYFTLTI